jgi:hypothetical protein
MPKVLIWKVLERLCFFDQAGRGAEMAGEGGPAFLTACSYKPHDFI